MKGREEICDPNEDQEYERNVSKIISHIKCNAFENANHFEWNTTENEFLYLLKKKQKEREI